MNAKAGESLLAVNGGQVRPPTNLYSLFENTAGKIVDITLGPNSDAIWTEDEGWVVENEGVAPDI